MPVTALTDPLIQQHQTAQADVPAGLLRLDDGELVKVGGRQSAVRDDSAAGPPSIPPGLLPRRATLPPMRAGDRGAALAHRVDDMCRGWGFHVEVLPGAYGRSNGLDWADGRPDATLFHHFVCKITADLSYRREMVGMLDRGYDSTPGPVVPMFIDCVGWIWRICSGPANHAGRGNSSVLNRIRQGKAPLGPAASHASGNDYTGNAYLWGREAQHPGDSTPWPTPMVVAVVASMAAECLVLGVGPEAAWLHLEHTDRKDDANIWGGTSGKGGGVQLRIYVGAWMKAAKAGRKLGPGTDLDELVSNPTEDDVTPEDKKDIIDGTVAKLLATKVGLAGVDMATGKEKGQTRTIAQLLGGLGSQANRTLYRVERANVRVGQIMAKLGVPMRVSAKAPVEDVVELPPADFDDDHVSYVE